MSKITSRRITQFCDKFEKLLKSRPKQYCSMDKTDVSPECKTPGCHGGWMSILFQRSGDYFEEGADALSKYLFRDKYRGSDSLREWAGENPDVWGNSYGNYMFSDNGSAFNQNSSVFPATVLLKHWRKVAQRLSLLEAMKRIK